MKRWVARVRLFVVVSASVGVAWWLAAGPLQPSVPGLSVVAVLAALAVADLGWARDTSAPDDAVLERALRGSWFSERERLCSPGRSSGRWGHGGDDHVDV